MTEKIDTITSFMSSENTQSTDSVTNDMIANMVPAINMDGNNQNKEGENKTIIHSVSDDLSSNLDKAAISSISLDVVATSDNLSVPSELHAVPEQHPLDILEKNSSSIKHVKNDVEQNTSTASRVKNGGTLSVESGKEEGMEHFILDDLGNHEVEHGGIDNKSLKLADSAHFDLQRETIHIQPEVEDRISHDIMEDKADCSNTGNNEPKKMTAEYTPGYLVDRRKQNEDSSLFGATETQFTNKNAESNELERKKDGPPFSSVELNHHPLLIGNMQLTTSQSEPCRVIKVNTGSVDTAAPFESVREAVTMFGGIVDWKAHKARALERRKHVEHELEKVLEDIPNYTKQCEVAKEAKASVLKELDSTKRLIEDLRVNLESAQTEEAQAKQDFELAQLRAQEMEQGIEDNASVVAKTQVEVAKARCTTAIVELVSVKVELESLRAEYDSLVNERDVAIKRAEETVSVSKEIEKTVEDLTLEFITAKEALESAHAAHLEAEEHRTGAALAREHDVLNWQKELKQAEAEVERLNERISFAQDLKSKLDMASALLLGLKAELAAYMEAKLEESECVEEKEAGDVEIRESHASIEAVLVLTRKDIDDVNTSIEKTKDEVRLLRENTSSMKAELEKEKSDLNSVRQREGMASVAVSSLETEVNRIQEEIEQIRSKEKSSRDKMALLPKQLQLVAQEANQAQLANQLAREELRRKREEADQVKDSASTVESRLHAALKEIEATRASERLALVAIKALEETEQAVGAGGKLSPSGVTIALDEYYNLNKQMHEAEELASERVSDAITQIHVAKESEEVTVNRLEETSRALSERHEALRIAKVKAEKAKEGKLEVEQELRKWRAELEKIRKANVGAALSDSNSGRSPAVSLHETMDGMSFSVEQSAVFDHPTPQMVSSKKLRRKKSFFPRLIMFLTRKRSASFKQ